MSTIVEEVRRELDEVNGGVFWQDQTVYDAINMSQLETYLVPGFSVAQVGFTLTTTDDIIALPSSVMIPLWIETSTNNPCWITTHVKLEQSQRDWKLADPAQPRWFVVWDATHLRVWPMADKSYDYVLYYLPWPTELSPGTDDVTEYPPTLRECLKHRQTAKLIQSTQPGFAEQQNAMAEELEQIYRRTLRRTGGVKLDRLRPATNYDRAVSGAVKAGQWYV